MKILNETELTDFMQTVFAAKGNVYLKSQEGDCYNLKSQLSRYIAIGKMIEEHGNDLELFCDNKFDEPLFYNFFENHPDTL